MKAETAIPNAAEAATAPVEQPQAEPATIPKLHSIDLDEPIVRGETRIESIQLRKPQAGELRGLQLQPLAQGDANSIMALVPRISNPPLLPHEVAQLGFTDFAAITGMVMDFFMSKQERETLGRMLGLDPPSTS